ncbi:hypothetical protein EG329_006033 [Mollisiaceae sp. DMI_Dod_QoI]|nr:hypothetical protein EG329_006033 [Helotiales sp. DMI_Dod_QoI]
MSYSQLADEIILQIIDLIPSVDIENFALIDSRTHRISLHKLQVRQALKRNARVVAARFGCTISPFNSICRRSLDSLERIYSQATAHLDYLELNGDLHWMQPPDPEIAGSNSWNRGQGVSKERLDQLVASGKRVGVEFPKAFLTLMGSTDLMERMFLGGDYFDLGPSLVKCNSDDDKDGGGYVIDFLSDQQCCRYWSLYVAPGGYHCVLNAPYGARCWKCAEVGPYGGDQVVWDDHTKCEVHEGVPIACEKLGVSLAHPNFEAWLAMNYFDGWCSIALRTGKDLTESQREYLNHFGQREEAFIKEN